MPPLTNLTDNSKFLKSLPYFTLYQAPGRQKEAGYLVAVIESSHIYRQTAEDLQHYKT